MKCLTCNNYIKETKDNNYSQKTLNNLYKRVRLLEKDLDKIKKQGNNKNSLDSSMSTIINKKINKMIKNEIELKSKNKNTNSQKSLNNRLFINFDNNNNININTYTCNKNKHKPKLNISQIYKKLNNYNNIITKKKENLFKITSHKRINSINNFKELSKVSLTKNNELYKNTYENFYSHKRKMSNKPFNNILNLDKLNIYANNNDNIIVDKNNIKKIEYEFEIRNLKKRQKILMNINKENTEKLNIIKNKNIKLEKVINKKEKNIRNILNNLYQLNKNYIIKKESNEFDSIESNSIRNNLNNNEFSLKNILLNIMNINLDYESNILNNKFIQGIKDLFNLHFYNNNNNNKICIHKIFNKINELINIQKNSEKLKEEYKHLIEDNNKYSIYLKNLLIDLNLRTLNDLEEVIHFLFIKNIKENANMKQIKKALIKEDLTTKRENQNRKNKKIKIKLKDLNNHLIYNISHDIFKNYTCHNFHKNKRHKINLKKYNNKHLIKFEEEDNKKHPRKILNRTVKNEKTLNINIPQNLYYKSFYEEEKRSYNTLIDKQYNIGLSEDNKNDEKIESRKSYKGRNHILNQYINQSNTWKNETFFGLK